MSFDYCKLRGRIVEKCGTLSKFSEMMGWSDRTTSLKMNGIRAWKQEEIVKAIEILDLSEKDIPEYFFRKKVQNIEHVGVR